GSEDSPFRSIQQGLDAQDEKAMVAVAAGTYLENLQMTGDHSRVHLAGRCRELVVLDGSAGPSDDFTLGSGIYLAGTSLTASWTISDLTVTAAPSSGIVQVNGSLTLNRFSTLGNERGLECYSGAIEGTDGLVEGNEDIGVFLANATATMVDIQVHDTEDGRGFDVESSTLSASDCLVQGSREFGIYMDDSEVSLDRVEILATSSTKNGTFGRGINAQNCTLVATDCNIRDSQELGVFLSTTTATLQDVRVSDTAAASNGEAGWGLSVQDQSNLVMTGGLVMGNRELGVFVDRSTASLQAVEVRENLVNDESGYGYGMVVQDSEITVTDSLFEQNARFGMYVLHSTGALEGVVVLDTLSDSSGALGRGIELEASTTITATDCILEGNAEVGMAVVDHSVATLDRVSITDTSQGTWVPFTCGLDADLDSEVVATGLEVSGTAGPGLYATLGGYLECTDCTLSGNAFAGAAVQSGADLVLRDTLVEGTVASTSVGGGVGVYASDFNQEVRGGPTLMLEGCTIRDNEMGAVYLEGGGGYQVFASVLSGGSGLDARQGVWGHGDAVFVTSGETPGPGEWDEEEGLGLLLENNVLQDSSGAGLFLDGASATLVENTWLSSGVDLVRQQCDASEAPEGLDEGDLTSELCPDYDYAYVELELVTQLVVEEPEF
ncbi:MAG: right-handed parallel beta-helix repeat-containing protein, partial [Myxococcota bacterium]|nr:right-handed parallel beta-helix repeat-containing protein [Myxococcota bacterium]